jgi:hypothetical protein
VRAIDGHGFLMMSFPSSSARAGVPSSFTTSISTPKSGSPALPGLAPHAPGSVVSIIEPVSVCHQVSTMGQRPPPITRWYQLQASGLIGSPTEPRRRSDERLAAAGHWSPARMNERIAVGAV